MVSPRLVFGDIRMSVAHGEGQTPRMERIARLTFDYVQELLHRELQHLGADVTVAHVAVPPIRLALETMDDEAIARTKSEYGIDADVECLVVMLRGLTHD